MPTLDFPAVWPWAEEAPPPEPFTFHFDCNVCNKTHGPPLCVPNERWFQEATTVSYGTCPQCDRKADVCYCNTCGPGLLFCRECFFDHREQEHGYEPPQADSEPLTNKDYAQDSKGQWSRASEDLPKELV